METACNIHDLQQDSREIKLMHGFRHHGANSATHFSRQCILIGARWNPTGLMHNQNQLHEVAVHDRQKHTRNGHLVVFGQLTHNRAVQSDKTRIAWIDRFDKDIARMHVCMEKVIAKDLGEENG